eukprot:TRINITY_DN3086_c0_g1_i1.p1 TRINITY_DN3086_c0_g1~~TRINITY_DN3086_c0_g1_i1.p1  ORF type:complete len:203 (-),score=31.46 TRINITY_DN3086_c0_g1_i1:470-1078(-)
MAGIPPPLAGAGPMGGPSSAAAAKAVVSKFVESAKVAMAQQRPWTEMVDRTTFAKPDNLTEASNRVKKNLNYFRANYMAVLLAVIIVSMLWNPMSIFWLFLLGSGWVYIFMIRVESITVMGRTLSDREMFLIMSAITILITFGLTSVGSILISGIVIGTLAICVHAAFRVPDDLFLDDQDAGGFLSFLGPNTVQLPTSIGHV